MSKKRIIGIMAAAIGVIAFVTYWTLKASTDEAGAVILLLIAVICTLTAHTMADLAAAEEPAAQEVAAEESESFLNQGDG